MEVPKYPIDVIDTLGYELEKNYKTYENRVREAENQYEERRAELMLRLGISNNL